MERQKFEDSFKKAFENAEVTPTEKVWSAVEFELATAEADRMKHRLVFYKMVAAASVIFALAAVGMSLYLVNENNAAAARTVASAAKTTPPDNATNEMVEKADEEKRSATIDRADTDNHSRTSKTGNAAITSSSRKQTRAGRDSDPPVTLTEYSSTIASDVRWSDEPYARVAIEPLAENALSAPLKTSRITFTDKQSQQVADPVALMLARLEKREQEIRDENHREQSESGGEERLWTSVGIAAGPFNTMAENQMSESRAVNATSYMKNTSVDQEARASGIAYSMGFNVGTKLSQRWVLQGGVNYLMQSSQYTAESAVGTADYSSFRPLSINEFGKLATPESMADNRFVSTAPYSVNNNVSYVSVPLQAGYVIVNKKLGIQINGGVATDLFVKNRKTADGAGLEDIEQGRGDDSPYRPLNISGLLGTEITYRMADRYRISLNPGLRYPLHSIYKTEVGIESTPVIFDLGVRFRYIFR